MIGVEYYTGIPVVWKQRSFFNYLLDEGYSELVGKGFSQGNSSQPQFVPLVTVKREYEWSQDEIDSELSGLIASQRWKWALFAVLAILGIFLLVTATVLLCKVKNLSNRIAREHQRD